MQLFSSGAAQAYANSFRPWKPNGGFENVKSDVGKKIFSEIPFMNFKAELEMAKAGLREYGGTVRQDMVNEASIEKTKIMYDRDNQESNKKAALSRLLSGGLGASNRGSSGGVTSLLGDYVKPVNPLDQTITDGRKFQAIEGMVNSDLADVTAVVKNGIGATVPQQTRGASLQVPQTGSAATLQTPELSSLKLDEKVLNEELEGILKSFTPGASQE